MVIDLTAVSIYTLVSTILGATSHIITYGELRKIKKVLKIQRMELSTLEVLSVLTCVMQVIENSCYKKTFNQIETIIAQQNADLQTQINMLTDRINMIDLTTISAKEDIIIEALAGMKKTEKDKKETKED